MQIDVNSINARRKALRPLVMASKDDKVRATWRQIRGALNNLGEEANGRHGCAYRSEDWQVNVMRQLDSIERRVR